MTTIGSWQCLILSALNTQSKTIDTKFKYLNISASEKLHSTGDIVSSEMHLKTFRGDLFRGMRKIWQYLSLS